jgi:hypothetical protein
MNRKYFFTLAITLTVPALVWGMRPEDVGYAERMAARPATPALPITPNKVKIVNETGENVITSLVTKAATGDDRSSEWKREVTIGHPRTGRLIVRPLAPHGILTIVNLNQSQGEDVFVNAQPAFETFPSLANNECVIYVSKQGSKLIFSKPGCQSLEASEAETRAMIESSEKIGISREDLYEARRLLASPTTPAWEILGLPYNASRTETAERYATLMEKWHPRHGKNDAEKALMTAFSERIKSAAAGWRR